MVPSPHPNLAALGAAMRPERRVRAAGAVALGLAWAAAGLFALGLAWGAAAGLLGPAPLTSPVPGETLVVLLLVAPVLEELVFRHGLQRRLRAAGLAAAPAIVLTALGFGLAHALTRSWALGLAVVAPALVMGLVYERRRRVLPCIAAHAGMNLFWLVAAAAWSAPALRIT